MAIFDVKLLLNLTLDVKKNLTDKAGLLGISQGEFVRRAIMKELDLSMEDSGLFEIKNKKTRKASFTAPISLIDAANAKAKENNLTLSSYIASLLQANVTSFPVLHKDEIEKLDECRDELRRIGNNVNQLSKHFNTTLNDFNPKGYKEFRALYKEIINLKSAISDLVKASKGGIWNGRN